MNFTYNTRGFLTKINDPASLGSDRFAMQIGYDAKVANGPSTGWSAEKNGNLSQIKWINRKFNDTALYYTFDYNSRDFLTGADNSNNSYDVTYGFDDNGNLTSLDRGTAWTGVDPVWWTPSGLVLKGVYHAEHPSTLSA